MPWSRQVPRGVRRRQRRIAEEGFVITAHDDAAGITARLPEVVLQYNSRRKARQDGGAVFDERVLEMLHESVIALSDQGRVLLTTIERDGECMGVGLSVAAGKVATGWIAGFDEAWSRFAPGICTLFASIEFAASRGYAEYDLGIGGQAYKYGIADREVPLELVELERRGLWPLQSPFQLVPLRRRPALIAGVDRCLKQARALRRRTEGGGPG
jgi:CelD/BcsL family acetyltransferase involved in cellulose biosynthesis